MSTDRIEKTTLLRAPLERVWHAISDSSQFGAWFGMRCEGPFIAGNKVRCAIVPTSVGGEVAEKQQAYEGVEFDIWVEEIVPQRQLSFRWIPYALDADTDPESAVKSLVTFELEEEAGGIRLTITESGFDAVPVDLRANAFSANEEGWTLQLQSIERYLASH
ncbi:MAG: SRPBCC family protein [Pseudomonadales bacterium]|jgi:uncharacterized protein YndB with AHSA1/START domain